MNKLKSLKNASNEEFGLLLLECPISGDMIPQISTRVKVHDKVKIILILERVLHVDNKRVLEG